MHTSDRRRRPVQRAVYGSSRLLGDVEFLTARFGAHRFAPHIHPVFAIGTVLQGACRVWHRGTSHLASPGDLILINPGDPHSADPATPGEWEYCAVYLSEETARRWIGQPATSPRPLKLQGVVGRDATLAASLGSLCRGLEQDPESGVREDAFASFMRALMSRFGSDSDASDGGADEASLERVRAYIERHYAEPLRIETLAQLDGRSPLRVIRAFNRRFGMPPYTYLIHVRVAEAGALLRHGRCLADIAAAVGFNDQSHLTRFFRRIMGVPPGQFARALREGSSAHPFSESPSVGGPPDSGMSS